MHRLLGVDCFDAIRLRRDLVLRDDSGNHRRRLRRRVSGWVRTDGKWTFLSLVFVFCWFRKFSSSSWTTRLRRRFGDENITSASRIGENMHSTARFVLYFVGFFFACDGKASVCVSLRGVPLKIWKMWTKDATFSAKRHSVNFYSSLLLSLHVWHKNRPTRAAHPV